jgi:hypothetical protein
MVEVIMMNNVVISIKNFALNRAETNKNNRPANLLRKNIITTKKICYTVLMVFLLGCVAPVKSQSFNNLKNIYFYGTTNSPSEPGADYFVFKKNENQIQGLVYVQGSDVFSCVKGIYNAEENQIENVIFSYPEMGMDYWEVFYADEPLYLNDFPYQLNYSDINESANALFVECLNKRLN